MNIINQKTMSDFSNVMSIVAVTSAMNASHRADQARESSDRLLFKECMDKYLPDPCDSVCVKGAGIVKTEPISFWTVRETYGYVNQCNGGKITTTESLQASDSATAIILLSVIGIFLIGVAISAIVDHFKN